jgi:hypothetical protein
MKLLRAVGLAVAFLALASEARALQTVQEVTACMRSNLPSRSSVQRVSLRHIDREGGDRVLEAKIFWKHSEQGQSNVRIQVEAPPDDRGSSYLLREHDSGDPEMFICSPEFGRWRRIHPSGASGPLFGTTISYQDVQHLQTIAEGSNSERLADSEIGDRAVSIVSVTSEPGSASSYERVVYFVDLERCVPMKVEFYATGGVLEKRLIADPEKITQEGQGWLVRRLTFEDLVSETRTELNVDEIEVEAKISDRMFANSGPCTRR